MAHDQARVHLRRHDGAQAMTDPCPDCQVDVGDAHDHGCDVARCLVTGLQRLSCREPHECGEDEWTRPLPDLRGQNWMVFEKADVGVERHGRFDWQVVRGFGDHAVVEYVGKPHWFRWTAWRHARRLPASYRPTRDGLTRGEALGAIGWPSD